MDPTVLGELAQCLQNTLSPDASVRKASEQMLENGENQHGFPIMLLMLSKAENQPEIVQITAAISFKNFVKKHWRLTENTDDIIGEDVRSQIRGSIIEIMLSSKDKIQKQICEAIGLIGLRDFPERWPDLTQQLAGHLNQSGRTDIRTAKGILQTASSLFNRYRNEFQTEKLIREIILVLDNFAQIFTDFSSSLVAAVCDNPQNVSPDMMNCLYLTVDVFYSLNFQDLPEFFEVNMQTWMAHFDKILKLQIPNSESPEPGEKKSLDDVKAMICETVAMYAQKYSEEFSPYLPTFVTDIWQVLEAAGQKAKCDQLASTAIQFLASIADRPAYANLFSDPNALKSICENVVLPNLYFRDEDEEDFEDNPEQYIRSDLEGADADTRRRAACELVKALNRNFEAQLVQHFSQYIVAMLDRYSQNKAEWKCKDTAIYLVTSIASKGQTQKHGTTKASELVNVQDFFTQHILPDISDSDVNALPVIKADGLKFVLTFRNQLTVEQLMSAIPCAIALLGSSSVVVMSYASHLLERLFVMKAPQHEGVKITKPLISADFVEQHAGRLFQIICNQILARPETGESVYAMRALLRSIWLLEARSLSHLASIVLPRLSERIVTISRNPSRPEFNHYLFETVCVCCHVACRKSAMGASALTELEGVLLPAFQTIIQNDVQEFLPYVFQVITLMLDYNDPGKISQTYMNMLPFFLQPAYWERKGNIPALTLLTQAYIEKSPNQITEEQVVGMLGIFQKLIMNKLYDHDGFRLLTALTSHIPAERMQSNIKGIFTIILQRLSSSKTPKFVRGLLMFMATFVRLPNWGGGDFVIETFDSIQPNLFGMLIERIFLLEAMKVQGWPSRFRLALGLAAFLMSGKFIEKYHSMWPKVVELAVQLVESQQEENNEQDDGDNFHVDLEEITGYEAAFSQLAFASRRSADLSSGDSVPLPTTGGLRWESFAKAQIEVRTELAAERLQQSIRQMKRALPIIVADDQQNAASTATTEGLEQQCSNPDCHTDQLPTEVLELILYYLRPYGDLQHAALVCKRWYRISKSLLSRRRRDFTESSKAGRLYSTVYDLPEGPAARYTHSCVYHKGSLYLFGGSNTESATFNDLWRFDLNSRVWHRVIAQGTPPSPRSMSTFVPYGDCLYLFGGWHPSPSAHLSPGNYQPRFFNDLDVFNTQSEQWDRIFSSPVPQPVCAHSTVVVESQKIMVVYGGMLINRRLQSRVWIFDLVDRIWEVEERVEGPRPDARYGHTAALIDDEHMLVFGGSQLANDEAGSVLKDCWLLTMPPNPSGLNCRHQWFWTRIAVEDEHLAPPTLWVLSPAKVNTSLVYFSKLSDKMFKQYTAHWMARQHAGESVKSNSPCKNGKAGRSLRRLEQLERYLVKKNVAEIGEIPESIVSARLKAFPHFLDLSTVLQDKTIRWLPPTFAIPPGAAAEQSLFHTIVATPYEAVVFGGLQTDFILLTSQDPMSRPACRRVVFLHALPLHEFSSPSL